MIDELNITVPIYYTKHYKTKKPKTFFVALNWFRNVNPFINNEVKHHYHQLVLEHCKGLETNFNTVHIECNIYLKNTRSDGPNASAVILKYCLDGFVEAGVLIDDNVKFVKSYNCKFFVDKENPRAEITIKKI